MAYKVFTNGSPLPASDLNTYLMNQSVMVFADSAARSAALTSPTEGMLTWLQDTDTYEYYNGSTWEELSADTSSFISKTIVDAAGDLIIGTAADTVARLAVGTNGQVLKSNGTTAVWSGDSGYDAWSQLATGNLTGAATIDVAVSGKNKLFVQISEASSASASSTFYVRFNSSSTSYNSFYTFQQNAATYASNQFNATTASNGIPLGKMTTSATSKVYGSAYLSGVLSSDFKFYTFTGGCDSTGSNGLTVQGHGIWTSTSVVTQIRLFSDTGNFDGGTYTIWGSD